VTLDYAFAGQPFCVIAQDNTTVFGTLDLAFAGQPVTPYTDAGGGGGGGGTRPNICIVT